MNDLIYILGGYLSGSVLYAWLIPKCAYGIDIRKISDDGNPGTANVFKFAGIGVGIIVVILEIMKGFVPVFLACKNMAMERALFPLVLAAPVLGHAFPVWNIKGGGKSIAVSFGSLMGMYPLWTPVLVLAGFYLLFSLVIVIMPHLVRSVITYGLFCGYSIVFVDNRYLMLGCLFISLVVVGKHLQNYRGERMEIYLGKWKCFKK